MIGITADTFDAEEVNSEVFVDSAALAMYPLDAEDVHIHSVEDAGSHSSSHRLFLRRLSESEIDITYIVVYTLDADLLNQGVTAQSAYEYLNKTLVESVHSGLFNTYLTAFATNLTAPDMEHVTTTSVAVGSYTEVGNDDGEGGSKEDTALIVGLVVGIGGGLILLCVCFVVIMRRRHKVVAKWINAGAPN